MATIVLVYPRDGGTYGTNADGSLVPFTARGYVDAPGATVTLYEDNTSALLGSTNASATPDAGGDYSGWYPWTIFVSSWTQAGGVSAPAASVSATAGGVSLTATLTAPAATATSSAGGILASSTTLQLVPAASATAAAGGVAVSGIGSVPAATATGTAGGISIAAPGGTSLGLYNPQFESAIGTAEGDNWWPLIGSDTPVAERTSTSPIAGAYSGRIGSSGFFDGEANVPAAAGLYARTTKAAIDASSGHVKFRAKRVAADLGAAIGAEVYNASSVLISPDLNDPAAAAFLTLWGSDVGAGSNVAYKITPTLGTIYDFDIDLSAWLQTLCTWANASKVVLRFIARGLNGYEEFTMDEFQAR